MERHKHPPGPARNTYPFNRPAWYTAAGVSLVPAAGVFAGLALWILYRSSSPVLGLILLAAGVLAGTAAMAWHIGKLSARLKKKMHHIQLLDQQLLKMSRMAAATKLTRDFLATLKDGLINMESSAALAQELIRLDTPSDAARNLEDIKTGAIHSCASIDKLLTITRTPGNHWIIQDIQINDMITDILELLAPQFREKQVKITLECEENPPMIRSNFSRVYQIFQNLLLTVVSDIIPKGQLIIATQSGSDGVQMTLVYPSRHFDKHILTQLSDPAYALQAQEPGPWLALCVYHADRVNARVFSDETDTGLQLTVNLPFRIDRSSPPVPQSFLKGL
ncbi:sensor histidine kinase [Desulfotignum phosphitoxidans]|nr:HAMP domain-containing histidine kinase [Desulfotignum phosphitoxidans]